METLESLEVGASIPSNCQVLWFDRARCLLSSAKTGSQEHLLGTFHQAFVAAESLRFHRKGPWLVGTFWNL